MHFLELDTPALLIEQEIMLKNIESMLAYANRHHVALRPHTKTHKTPKLALLQEQMGCQGITVAKVGEAEEMAAAGLRDIFIANEIVGDAKLRRIRKLAETIEISFGLDSIEQAKMVENIFDGASQTAKVLIEIEVGENRSGVVNEQDFLKLLDFLKTCNNIHVKGLFSHDGNSYSAPTRQAAREISVIAQQRTLQFAGLAREQGFGIADVSIGSTPSQANNADILAGVTEIRPGTFIFMDASQGHALEDMSICAATVLATVMSKPTEERVILDVGAKGITMQSSKEGICATPGLGTILEYPSTHIDRVYDEHGIIYDKDFHDAVKIGDKIRIIPVHICPVVNLYEKIYLIDKAGNVVDEIPVKCRGKLQ
jgi:D-serine deaminase-like pyridoxal phosphate-dependent protein